MGWGVVQGGSDVLQLTVSHAQCTETVGESSIQAQVVL